VAPAAVEQLEGVELGVAILADNLNFRDDAKVTK
jgi:hypothetical protein